MYFQSNQGNIQRNKKFKYDIWSVLFKVCIMEYLEYSIQLLYYYIQSTNWLGKPGFQIFLTVIRCSMISILKLACKWNIVQLDMKEFLYEKILTFSLWWSYFLIQNICIYRNEDAIWNVTTCVKWKAALIKAVVTERGYDWLSQLQLQIWYIIYFVFNIMYFFL